MIDLQGSATLIEHNQKTVPISSGAYPVKIRELEIMALCMNQGIRNLVSNWVAPGLLSTNDVTGRIETTPLDEEIDGSRARYALFVRFEFDECVSLRQQRKRSSGLLGASCDVINRRAGLANCV